MMTIRSIGHEPFRKLGPAALLAAAMLLLASPALSTDVGPRMGLTVNPDQVHFGFQIHAADATPQLAFMPNFEVGVGDNLVGVALNFDMKYVVATRAASWRPYLGAGPGIFFGSPTQGHGDSFTDVGLNLFGGMQTPTRSGYFYTEARVGIIDVPDLKFTVGWQFLR